MAHLKRAKTSRKYPIKRKGTKYVARANSHFNDGVPVVVAVRDILGLARTSKEVQGMVNQRILKINGRAVRDIKEGIKMMNVFEADKSYVLSVLLTGRFIFEAVNGKTRLCKIMNKKILPNNKVQLNLHDGTNVLAGKEKSNIGDSVELGFDGKVQKIISLEKGKSVFVISGKSIGKTGKVESVDGRHVKINFDNKEVVLDKEYVVVK